MNTPKQTSTPVTLDDGTVYTITVVSNNARAALRQIDNGHPTETFFGRYALITAHSREDAQAIYDHFCRARQYETQHVYPLNH